MDDHRKLRASDMGDLGCYLRGAWAVRSGNDLYTVQDDNGWHYNYPPLLAILATPLADAPAGVDRAGLLPYGVSVGVWYTINVACLFLGAGVPRTGAGANVCRPGGAFSTCRLPGLVGSSRSGPVLACMPPLGSDLVPSGQVNVMLLALVCGLMAGLLRGRPSHHGPLPGRGHLPQGLSHLFADLSALAAARLSLPGRFALGLFVGLAVIPTAVFGPARAWRRYHTFATVILAPGLGDQTDKSRLQELTAVTTDTQSFLAVIHNTLHRDPATRPEWVDPWVRNVHWLLGPSSPA